MVKAGIYQWFGYPIKIEKRYKMIKEAGFYSIMLWWGDRYKEFDGEKELLPDLARKSGLHIENIHAPTEFADNIWKDCIDGTELENRYMDCIKVCKRHKIDTLVIHTPMKKDQIYNKKVGLNRINCITEFAQEFGINIAVENLSRLDYLHDIFSNIKFENLGFCYDSGHDNYYTKDSDLLATYGDRLMAIHLHDNDGTGDQHFLIGEGNVNWVKIKNDIHNSTYLGSITLELSEKLPERYKDTEAEIFLKEAFSRVQSVFSYNEGAITADT